MKEIVPSWALLVSVLVCAFAILFFQYFYYLPLLEQNRGSGGGVIAGETGDIGLLSEYLPDDYNAVLCNDIADGRSVAPNTMCVIKPGEKLQTFAAIKVWNYRDRYWMEPPGYVQAGELTILDGSVLGGATLSPTLLSCPWGCTLGYPL